MTAAAAWLLLGIAVGWIALAARMFVALLAVARHPDTLGTASHGPTPDEVPVEPPRANPTFSWPEGGGES